MATDGRPKTEKSCRVQGAALVAVNGIAALEEGRTSEHGVGQLVAGKDALMADLAALPNVCAVPPSFLAEDHVLTIDLANACLIVAVPPTRSCDGDCPNQRRQLREKTACSAKPNFSEMPLKSSWVCRR